MTNIQTNEVQAIEGKGKLRISTAGKNETVIETTEGTGLGIAKEYLSEIHDPFFYHQGAGYGNLSGTGHRPLTGGQRWWKN